VVHRFSTGSYLYTLTYSLELATDEINLTIGFLHGVKYFIKFSYGELLMRFQHSWTQILPGRVSKGDDSPSLDLREITGDPRLTFI